MDQTRESGRSTPLADTWDPLPVQVASCDKPASGVVLAAGFSSSMLGICKLALMLDGLPLLIHAMQCLLPFCGRIAVVTGAHADEVGMVLESYKPIALLSGTKIEIVCHPGFEAGMFSSLQAGIRHLLSRKCEDRIFVIPGDCAFVDESVCASLLQVHAEVVMPVFEEKPGHPVLVGPRFAREILLEPVTTSLRDMMAAGNPARVPVLCAGILQDVDTPAEWEMACREGKGGDSGA